MVLASLGVLKSCAAYQPLDPSYSPERLEFMIKDASAKLLIHAFITTQVGRQFADYYTGQSLKYLYVGGERLAPFFPENKSFTFFNGYGPTETTVLITFTPVKKLYRRVPIGAAFDNMKLYIVDKNGRRLPPYMPGELWVSGHQVGRSYLNRPEKNAESVIANPFTDEEGYT